MNTSTKSFDVLIWCCLWMQTKSMIVWIWLIVALGAATKANYKHEIGGDRMRRVVRPEHTAVGSDPHSRCPVGGHLCPDQRNTNPWETLWKLVGAHERRAHSLYVPGGPFESTSLLQFFVRLYLFFFIFRYDTTWLCLVSYGVLCHFGDFLWQHFLGISLQNTPSQLHPLLVHFCIVTHFVMKRCHEWLKFGWKSLSKWQYLWHWKSIIPQFSY